MHGVVILCGGQQQRLHMLGYPKQLIRVAGEPLLYRTVRLLRQLQHEPRPIVVAGHLSWLQAACDDLRVTHQEVDCAALLLSAERVMRAQGFESATILLGDVCWSEALLEHWIVECAERPTLMCARHGGNPVTGKPYSEHFAAHATLGDLRRLDARRFFCLADAARTGVFGSERLVEQPITDFTEDFDTLEDVERLVPLLSGLINAREQRAA